MTLGAARELRDVIRKEGIHCVVNGEGPRRYYSRITTAGGDVKFRSMKSWSKYKAVRDEHHRRLSQWMAEQSPTPRRRTPLEIMIDRACGLE